MLTGKGIKHIFRKRISQIPRRSGVRLIARGNKQKGSSTMQEKKNILTYEGLRKYEDELHDLKVVKRKEVAEKIKEAREQGDLSENAEYDAAKDE